MRVTGAAMKAHLSCPQRVSELSEAPPFNRLSVSLSLSLSFCLISPEHIVHIVLPLWYSRVFASSASTMEFITRGPGLQQHSL